MLKDLSFIPLTLWFHPSLVAATFLAWTRQYLLEQLPLNTKSELPEMLYGNAWYLYVDSGIKKSELDLLLETLKGEFSFIIELLNGGPAPSVEPIESKIDSGQTTQTTTTPEESKPAFY